MSKEYKVFNGNIKITEIVEQTFSSRDLESKLTNISREKTRLLEQNKEIVRRYAELVTEEETLQEMLNSVLSISLQEIGEIDAENINE